MWDKEQAAADRNHLSTRALCDGLKGRRSRVLIYAVFLTLLLMSAAQLYSSLQNHQGGVLRAPSFRPDQIKRNPPGLQAGATGEYSFTVVTAMLDIGRGNWTRQSRPYQEYLNHFQLVLQLKVNLIAFVDQAALPHVQSFRRGQEAHTKVIQVNVEDLPYYQHKQRVAEIMASESYRQNNDLVRQGLAEAINPVYDIVQWSKLTWLGWAMDWDPFNTSGGLFMWLDGGYTQGQAKFFPPENIWIPNHVLLNHLDKVTFIEREPVENYRQHAAKFHKMSMAILVGGYFAGGQRALRRLHELQRELIADWMKTGIADDDQTIYALLYFKEPELFNLVRGDWFDVFKLFCEPKSAASLPLNTK